MSLKTALRMAKASDLAYKDNITKQWNELGYHSSKFIDIDGAQCYGIWNNEEFVLCFRGTEPSEIGDILADLNAIPRGAMTHGLVHSGFMGELDKLWDEIVKLQKDHEGKIFYITGHSLGAAMATIATSRFEEYTYVHELYTFGSPRAGTKSFVNNIFTTHYRYVNNNDIVTSVPMWLMFYRHHGNLTYINFYGNIRKMTLWQRMKDKFRGRWRALQKRQPFDGAFDHSMGLYVQCISKNCEENK